MAAAIDGETERHWPRCKAGPDNVPHLAVLLIYTPEDGFPFQVERDRGIFESVKGNPTRVTIGRSWDLACIPTRTGTFGLLVILQATDCIPGSVILASYSFATQGNRRLMRLRCEMRAKPFQCKMLQIARGVAQW